LSAAHLSQVRNGLPGSKSGRARNPGRSAARSIKRRCANRRDGWIGTKPNDAPQDAYLQSSEGDFNPSDCIREMSWLCDFCHALTAGGKACLPAGHRGSRREDREGI